jgi:type IV secretion system protein VirB9
MRRVRVAWALLLLGAGLAAEGRAQSPAQLPWPADPDDGVALRRSAAAQRSERARTVRRGGVEVADFGQGQPLLLCAPWRACHIRLQEGEELRDKSGGDLVRWKVWAMRGPGNSYLVAIKPRFCDISTNLVFTTNWRIYDVMLDSPSCGGADVDSTRLNPNLPYTSMLVYNYPEDEVEGAAFRVPPQASVGQAAGAAGPGGTASPAPTGGAGADPGVAAGGLNFGYEVRHDRGFPWRPSYVYDDGRRTTIHLPEKAREGEIPVLYQVSLRGECEMVDYDYDPETNRYTVHQVADRLVLVFPGGSCAGGRLRLVMQRTGRAG